MIYDANNRPRYFDKPWENRTRKISPELKRLYVEMENNPKFHVSRENNFYPAGFPKSSPGWA